MSFLGTLLKAAFGGIFSSIVSRFFPPKTAADQRADDLAATTKEASDAVKTSESVSRQNLADVESDLDKRVRDPNA
jgi:hypothetical protein